MSDSERALANKQFPPDINEKPNTPLLSEQPKSGLRSRTWVKNDPARSPEINEQRKSPQSGITVFESSAVSSRRLFSKDSLYAVPKNMRTFFAPRPRNPYAATSK